MPHASSNMQTPARSTRPSSSNLHTPITPGSYPNTQFIPAFSMNTISGMLAAEQRTTTHIQESVPESPEEPSMMQTTVGITTAISTSSEDLSTRVALMQLLEKSVKQHGFDSYSCWLQVHSHMLYLDYLQYLYTHCMLKTICIANLLKQVLTEFTIIL